MAPAVMESIIIENGVQTNAPPQPTFGILSHPSANPWSPSTVLSTLPSISRPTSHTSSPVPFFHLLERLKTTKREGWRRFGINHGESISDHMYRMSIITMMAPRSLATRLNLQRCTKMALVHDMAELLVGDITPVDGILKSEKSRRESTTMDYLCGDLLSMVDGGEAAAEIRDLWQEYEDGQTLESKFVHDVDKLELVLQMVEYEKAHEGRIDLGEFTWVAGRIELPEVREWCEQVLSERGELWKQVGRDPSGILNGKNDETEEEGGDAERKKQHDEYYGNGSQNGH